MTGCSQAECTRPSKARGLCKMHYEISRAAGHPTAVIEARQCRYCDRVFHTGSGLPSHERRHEFADSFWSHVDKGPNCWEWTGPRNEQGYGKFGLLGKDYRASRLSWTLTNGPIPDGLLVCHRCDNPPCVRPDHLFLGTHRDNSRDASQKGRLRRAPRPAVAA